MLLKLLLKHEKGHLGDLLLSSVNVYLLLQGENIAKIMVVVIFAFVCTKTITNFQKKISRQFICIC